MSKGSKWVSCTIGGILFCFIVFVALSIFLPREWFVSAKTRQDRNMSRCAPFLKQIGLGLIMYANENDGKFPDKLSELYDEFISEIRMFFYPGEKKEIKTHENIDSLGWFEYMGTGLTQDADPYTILAHVKDNNNWRNRNGVIVLFANGHIEFLAIKVPLVVESLIAALNDKNTLDRKKAAISLGILKDTRAVEPLIAALKDEDSSNRVSVAIALGILKDTRTVEPLIAALKDKDTYLRRYAAEALSKIKDPRAVQAIKEYRGRFRK